MRWSNIFIPTLRDEPAHVEAASHRLLLRAGYIRLLTAGVYSLLPLAQRVRLKIIEIIRQEMNEIGGQEFLLSALQPMELWEESGRKDAVSDIMFCLKDRKNSELALGLTHEEVFTSIAKFGLSSYKQLPQIWYQIQTKFRDELRPRAGLLRVREFTMKDSYSFDLDESSLSRSYQLHFDAYCRIFKRCGLDFIPVQASSGAMGGSDSTEFMYASPAGEDTLVICENCRYSANLEKAESSFGQIDLEQEPEQDLLEFHTPEIRSIKQLAEFEGGARASRQIKTLVFVSDFGLLLALLRGDQELNESKLQAALKSSSLRQANDSEIFDAMGAHAGSLGACGLNYGEKFKIKTIVADRSLEKRVNMLTGANKDDYHYRGVSMKRDIQVERFVDLHTVQEGEACIKCGGKLKLCRGLEIGHIFKLATRYSEAMNARVLAADGSRLPIFMGSYGIGVERLMAAIVEASHDRNGIKWPPSVAPFDLVIMPVNRKDEEQWRLAQELYFSFRRRDLEVLLDDREERPGVKFKDFDLIGVPYRLTIGKGVGQGVLEFQNRLTDEKSEIALSETVDIICKKLSEQKNPQ
ncbi:MAG: proline--tRNA ligase [Candidatus Obscuribacterales bacterium]|nr:proline--tRNA ligase [Candidatus Obscuribacterales bacterium]